MFDLRKFTCCIAVLFIFVNAFIVHVKCDEIKKRPKRYVRFLEKTKYFVRLNTKHNMVPEFRIFAQATGFRVNFDDPVRFGRFRHKIMRRDLYQNLEQLILQHGYDGRACVLKSLCEASKIVTPQSGILLKLFKKIFTIPEGDDKNYPYLNSEQCDVLDEHCPLSLIHLTNYTDE